MYRPRTCNHFVQVRRAHLEEAIWKKLFSIQLLSVIVVSTGRKAKCILPLNRNSFCFLRLRNDRFDLLKTLSDCRTNPQFLLRKLLEKMSWFVSYIPLKYFPVSTCFLWSSSKPELFWPFSKALPCCYGKLPVKISRNAFCFQVEGPEKSRWIVTESLTSRYARLPCRWYLIQPSSLLNRWNISEFNVLPSSTHVSDAN